MPSNAASKRRTQKRKAAQKRARSAERRPVSVTIGHVSTSKAGLALAVLAALSPTTTTGGDDA